MTIKVYYINKSGEWMSPEEDWNLPLLDWKGNVVKEGDELLIMWYRPDSLYDGHLWWQEVPEHLKQPHKPEQIYTWETGYYGDIFRRYIAILEDGKLGYRLEENGYLYPIHRFKHLINENFQVICIKGISDNKEEFFNSRNIDIKHYDEKWSNEIAKYEEEYEVFVKAYNKFYHGKK